MRGCLPAWMFALIFGASTASAEIDQAIPSIPAQAVDKYVMSYYEEPVESLLMTRIRLTGRIDFILDIIPEHQWKPNPSLASAEFYIPLASDFNIKIVSFPKRSFTHQVDVETLTDYLEGQALLLAEQQVEILEYPEVTTGRSKFRIFGQRALTLSYSLNKNGTRITHSENWAEYDDIIHVVIVECPSASFARYYKEVRGYLNSMSYFREE
jgi:hypothetical protein